MSDKPDNPNYDEPQETVEDDKTLSLKDRSHLSKPKKPNSGKKTSALKLPLNYELLPDNKAATPDKSSQLSHTDDSLDNDASESEFFNFNKKPKTEPTKNPKTAVLPNESVSWKKVIEAQEKGVTSKISEQREVLFVIRGMIERVVMKDNGVVTLGRFDTGTIPDQEIDLLPYGALDRGVSRRHCKIQLKDNQLYVTDLQSTNGTFLAGMRLNSNEPMVLRKGDELLLGRLAVQILFR